MYYSKENQLNQQLNERFKLLQEIDDNTLNIESFYNYNKEEFSKIQIRNSPKKSQLHEISKCKKKAFKK